MLLLGGLAPLCIAKFLLDALLLLVLMQKREKAGALFRKPRFADDAGTRISKGVDLIHIHPARDKDLNQAIVAVGPARLGVIGSGRTRDASAHRREHRHPAHRCTTCSCNVAFSILIPASLFCRVLRPAALNSAEDAAQQRQSTYDQCGRSAAIFRCCGGSGGGWAFALQITCRR